MVTIQPVKHLPEAGLALDISEQEGKVPDGTATVRASHADPGTRSISPAPGGPLVTGRPLDSADPGILLPTSAARPSIRYRAEGHADEGVRGGLGSRCPQFHRAMLDSAI